VQKATSADTTNPPSPPCGVVAVDSPNTLKKIVAFEKGSTAAATQAVSITFDVTAGGQAVSCGVP
jgi:hypothetical protein